MLRILLLVDADSFIVRSLHSITLISRTLVDAESPLPFNDTFPFIASQSHPHSHLSASYCPSFAWMILYKKLILIVSIDFFIDR